MKLFKNIFTAIGVLPFFTAFLFAANAYNETELADFFSLSSSGTVNVSSSILISANMGSYSGKQFEILLNSSTQTYISGANLYEGFLFENSDMAFVSHMAPLVLKNFFSLSSGAAINVFNSTLSVYNLHFSANSAFDGGAIYAASSTVNIDSSSFAFNFSSGAGGAFYAFDSKTSISGSDFNFNVSSVAGGAVYIESGIANFSNLRFSSNTAVYGSDIYLLLSSASISGSSFKYGKSDFGALYVSSSSLLLNESDFTANEALQAGAAVYAENSILDINKTEITGNSSALAAGGFYMQNVSASMAEVSFQGNMSSGAAGAVYGAGSYFIARDSLFSSNVSLSSGGAGFFFCSQASFNNSGVSYNVASLAGGGFYIIDSTAVFQNVDFNSNESFAGGALYMENSQVKIDGGSFSGNKAFNAGGALYVKNSQLTLIGALSFSSNYSQTLQNDLYLDAGAKLIFETQMGKDMVFNGGIVSSPQASGIEITKTGGGSLILGGRSVLNASFVSSEGMLILQNDSSFSVSSLEIASGSSFVLNKNASASFSSLSINQGASIETKNIASFNAANLDMSGTLKIGIDARSGSADIINAENINLDSSSSLLKFGGNLSAGSNTYLIMRSTNAISGTFKETSGSFGARTVWSIAQSANEVLLNLTIKSYRDIAGLFEGNAKEAMLLVSGIYDFQYAENGDLWNNVISPIDAMGIEDLRKTAERLSGSFYSDIFSVSALTSDKSDFFERIALRNDDNSWMHVSGNIVSLKNGETGDEIKDTNFGLKAGWDLYDNYVNKIAGVTFGYNYHDITAPEDKAKAHEFNAGFYGGFLGDTFEFKGILTLGLFRYAVERNIFSLGQTAQADFTSYDSKAALQAAALIRLGSTVVLRPFVGADGVFVKNESFSESASGAQLRVESQNYIRSSAGGGLGLQGNHEKFSWYINVSADYLIIGNENKIKTSFELSRKAEMEVSGVKQGELAAGASLGFEISAGESSSVYINAGYVSSENYENISANLGFRYRFDFGFNL